MTQQRQGPDNNKPFQNPPPLPRNRKIDAMNNGGDDSYPDITGNIKDNHPQFSGRTSAHGKDIVNQDYAIPWNSPRLTDPASHSKDAPEQVELPTSTDWDDLFKDEDASGVENKSYRADQLDFDQDDASDRGSEYPSAPHYRLPDMGEPDFSRHQDWQADVNTMRGFEEQVKKQELLNEQPEPPLIKTNRKQHTDAVINLFNLLLHRNQERTLAILKKAESLEKRNYDPDEPGMYHIARVVEAKERGQKQRFSDGVTDWIITIEGIFAGLAEFAYSMFMYIMTWSKYRSPSRDVSINSGREMMFIIHSLIATLNGMLKAFYLSLFARIIENRMPGSAPLDPTKSFTSWHKTPLTNFIVSGGMSGRFGVDPDGTLMAFLIRLICLGCKIIFTGYLLKLFFLIVLPVNLAQALLRGALHTYLGLPGKFFAHVADCYIA